MNSGKLTIFYSYSHKDETFRDALETHLTVLARKNIIASWHDRKIPAGQEWKKQIDKELETADIVLLLISSDFIASDYCYEKELKIAMERHESNQAIVIPIIIRPSEWSDTPFSNLQALPKDAKAITSWENEDEAWLNVVAGIKKAIEKMQSLRKRADESKGFYSIKDCLRREVDSITEVHERNEGGDAICGLPTGLIDLDQLIDGIHPSEFITVAGRPGMGKTNFALQLSANVAMQTDCPVAYFSLNLPSERVTRKLLSSFGRLNTQSVARGDLFDHEWPRLSSAISLLAETPLFIDDTFSMTLNELRAKAIEIKRKGTADSDRWIAARCAKYKQG